MGSGQDHWKLFSHMNTIDVDVVQREILLIWDFGSKCRDGYCSVLLTVRWVLWSRLSTCPCSCLFFCWGQCHVYHYHNCWMSEKQQKKPVSKRSRLILIVEILFQTVRGGYWFVSVPAECLVLEEASPIWTENPTWAPAGHRHSQAQSL